MDTEQTAATPSEGDNLSPEERRLRGIPEPKPQGEADAKTAKSDADADASEEDAGEGDTEGHDDEEGDEKPRKRRRRTYSDLKAELRELRALVEQKPKAEAPPADAGKGEAKPRLEDFKSYDDYQEALTDWKVDQRLKAERETGTKREREQAEARYQAELNTHVNKSVERARDKYDDFEDAMSDNGKLVFPNAAMLRVVSETDDPGEVAYYLAKHPDEAKRIAGLNPIKAAKELGKIEMKLSAPAAKKVSNAPPPPSNVGGGKSKPKSDANLSPDEVYRKFRAG